MSINFAPTSRFRVFALTAAGTFLCIVVALAFDSYSFDTGAWRWGSAPLNNVILPLILACPLLWLLLSKQRELALAHEELLVASSIDSLTQCLNRRAYTAMVEGYLSALNSGRQHGGAFLVIDVDYFKTVNDRFGHDKGDEALQIISSAIRHALEPADLVARIGGEEFSVFLARVSDERQAMERSERIRRAISDLQFRPRDDVVPLSASVGGVLVAPKVAFLDIYRAADQELYRAKANGRNRVSFSSSNAS